MLHPELLTFCLTPDSLCAAIWVIAIFCVASSVGLHSCLWPFVKRLPFCKCRWDVSTAARPTHPPAAAEGGDVAERSAAVYWFTLRSCLQGPREQLAVLAQKAAGAHAAAVGVLRGCQRHLDGVPQWGWVSVRAKAHQLQDNEGFQTGQSEIKALPNSGFRVLRSAHSWPCKACPGG